MDISFTYDERNFSKNSMEELFEMDLPLTSNNIEITLHAWDGDIIKTISINLSVFRNISIKGHDQIWVNGLKEVLVKFFKERKAITGTFNDFLGWFLVVLPGPLLILSFFSFTDGHYLFGVMSLILGVLGFTIIHPRILNKLFPYFIINFFSKEEKKRDIATIATVAGTIFGFLSFIATIVFGILTFV